MKKTIITLLSTLSLAGCLEGPTNKTEPESNRTFVSGFQPSPNAHQVESMFWPNRIHYEEPNNDVEISYGKEYPVKTQDEIETLLKRLELEKEDRARLTLNGTTLILERDLNITIPNVMITGQQIKFNGFKIIFNAPTKAKTKCSFSGNESSTYQPTSQYINFSVFYVSDLNIRLESERASLKLDHVNSDGEFNLFVAPGTSRVLVDQVEILRKPLLELPAENSSWVAFTGGAQNVSNENLKKLYYEFAVKFNSVNFVNSKIDASFYSLPGFYEKACFNFETAASFEGALTSLGYFFGNHPGVCDQINLEIYAREVCEGGAL